jgi:hypothetical protein
MLEALERGGSFASLLVHFICTSDLASKDHGPRLLRAAFESGISVSCGGVRGTRMTPLWAFYRPPLVWHEFLANVLGAPLVAAGYSPGEHKHLGKWLPFGLSLVQNPPSAS